MPLPRRACAAPATVSKCRPSRQAAGDKLSLTTTVLALRAWEGGIAVLASPDTGQDRWKCANGDVRDPNGCLPSSIVIVSSHFCSIWPTGTSAGCILLTENYHDPCCFPPRGPHVARASHCRACRFRPSHARYLRSDRRHRQPLPATPERSLERYTDHQLGRHRAFGRQLDCRPVAKTTRH